MRFSTELPNGRMFQLVSHPLRKLAQFAAAVGLIAAGAPALAEMSATIEPAPATLPGTYGYAAPAPVADQQFKALFQSWKQLDHPAQATVSVPSMRPVNEFTFTSSFGVRSDPFRGSAAMHAGVDLAAKIGTPIFATADGFVGRAEWANGYGNLVELEHGKGIATRYGHLSSILVHPGQHVKRGDLIALMGSTGRSTGSHLHYEVRIDGRAVNPVPFIEAADSATALQRRSLGAQVALGGPLIPASRR